VESRDLKASIALLNGIFEQDLHRLLAQEVDYQLSATGMSPHDRDIHELLTRLENPAYAAMRAKIQAELEREYLLPEDQVAGA
jgi:hypothetical protein